MVPGAPEPGRRRPDAARRRDRHRPRRELRRAALVRRGERPVHAQRPPVLHPDGARAGLLAGIAPGRAERRRAAPRGRADQGARLQRRPHPPEGRGPALPLLVRSARPAGLGRDGERLRLLDRGRRAVHPRVAGRGPPRRQPSLHRDLGADQRELGRAQPRGRSRPSATTCGRSLISPGRSIRRGP